MSFNMIYFQTDLAREMLRMPSFRRLFADDAYARTGFSKRGRRRTKRAAIKRLMVEGYTESQAEQIVQDAQDYASLLYRSNAERAA